MTTDTPPIDSRGSADAPKEGERSGWLARRYQRLTPLGAEESRVWLARDRLASPDAPLAVIKEATDTPSREALLREGLHQGPGDLPVRKGDNHR